MSKLWSILRFEVAYQLRRVSTWLYFAVLLGLTYQFATEAYIDSARRGGFHFNSPFVVAAVTLLGSVMVLLVAAATAGDAGARDVQTRMHALVYSAPLDRASYLGGRFLGAFLVSAIVLLGVPAGVLLAALVPGPEAALLGPFRPAVYVGAYVQLALPNAFIATAVAFALATLGRRPGLSYLGAVLLFFVTMLAWQLVAVGLGRWELGRLLDPLALTAMSELSRSWTAAEKNARAVTLEGALLTNRLLWLGVACGLLALTHLRFRFAHPGARSWRRAAPDAGTSAAPDDAAAMLEAARRAPIAAPRVRRTFDRAAQTRQLRRVTRESFAEIVTGWGGLGLAALTVLLVLAIQSMTQHLGVPLLPTTGHLTTYIGDTGEIVWMIIPLLIAYYAGELVWRERDAGLHEIADAAPVPEWIAALGRFLGLALVLAALQLLMMGAAMLVQARMGYHDFELGLYARILLGLQLGDYLLFALLAIAMHVIVDQKYVGHTLVLLAYALTTFATSLGIDQPMLVYRSDPGWSYSDLRGFGPTLAPVLWFRLYWAAWALLLAVATRLLWVRGTERGLAARLQLARRRFTRPVGVTTLAATSLVVAVGGYLFYNTAVLRAPSTGDDAVRRSVAYERLYGRFEGAPQPQLASVRLRVELHPTEGAADIDGSYRLVNASGVAIDTVHVATATRVGTGELRFDRAATRALVDDTLGHRVYVLAAPLPPGDSLRMDFTVRHRPRGFASGGIDLAVTPKATYVAQSEWLPAIGYQPERALSGAGERRAQGLPPRPSVRALEDEAARRDMAGAERITVDAVVGTDAGQVAVAPGALRRTWTERGRRYFHYATDVPIRNELAIYSAAYAVDEARWSAPAGTSAQPVALQVLHHPAHTRNVARMLRSMRATLDYQTARFGPYPYGQLRLVERAGRSMSLHASPIDMWFQEGFAIMNPDDDPRDIDFAYAVVAHEVAHQWWGNQLMPAVVQGAPLLTESLAWYSALGVVEQTYGRAHLDRLLAMMRESYLSPRARAGQPLLRTYDRLIVSRKGPFAMFAAREYVGEARVDGALRRLVERFGDGAAPLPTSLDLYHELRAATPDSLHPLLADLFERNAYWQLATERATAEPMAGGAWRVTMDVKARKVVVDSLGIETELPMDDLVEIGVQAAGRDGEPGAPLYRRLHRVRGGTQRIVVTVPARPARAGLDPRHLLIDVGPGDNVSDVTTGARP
ncbi:ABC transporter permease/M1 family aminopeptidase [Roseisolibacter agri]|uniref:ABC-2 family transporter protein n=1 Tax=Roseisolibacter agri TaxID=2014610 RepID=A0AA37QBZ0_9BACT|nr:hypothetical protein [Roseisolibacter agri]GLC26926.1 hypothetical protein rosag_34390 [Roseisolibacter agri]